MAVTAMVAVAVLMLVVVCSVSMLFARSLGEEAYLQTWATRGRRC